MRSLLSGLLVPTVVAVLASCQPEPPGEDNPVDPAPAAPEPLALACPATLAFAPMVAGETGRARLSCPVVGTAQGQVSIRGLRMEAPFDLEQVTAPEAAAGGVVHVDLIAPSVEAGSFTTPLQVDYERAGELLTVTVQLSANVTGWDPGPTARACTADSPAPLLEQVLLHAGLSASTFRFTPEDLAQSQYVTTGYLSDPFLLSWFGDVRAGAARIGCAEADLASSLDELLHRPHPVAALIRRAAELVDRPFDAPPVPPAPDVADLASAIEALCAGPAAPCAHASGEVPPDLGKALAPVLRAVHAALTARGALNPGGRTHDFWWSAGGHLLLPQKVTPRPDPSLPDDAAYLLGADRARLYAAAAQLAWAIESVDWSAFRGQLGPSFELPTAAGIIRVRDGAAHTHAADGVPVLLSLDLGGDDVYLGPIASNSSGANAVSVAIDLGGADRYTYAAVPSPADREGLPPADSDGRYLGDTNFGPVSFSRWSRQGAARNGVALLFDLGEDNDRYESLRYSQGYAHQGVGVLFDGGGDDTYVAEALAQGAAQFGIGLAIDAGAGRDVRSSFTYSQGFGYVGAAGFLIDGGGDDEYRCNHGDPAQGGIRLYYSPQMATDGNSSFCQGAGFGMRGQTRATHLSGGLGILRDLGGDDRYEASVFAQGTGYWQGTGILSDASGSDLYDAYYYVQGGAAHYAVGVLADDGEGNDRFNTIRPGRYVALGSGHDFSLGALLNEGGNDEYRIPALSAGASNCNGIGVLVDARGADRYEAPSDYGSGMGNASPDCATSRPNAKSVGIMIDAGGADQYIYPASSFPVPVENGLWGHARAGLPSEHGGGIDGEGEPGLHPGGS